MAVVVDADELQQLIHRDVAEPESCVNDTLWSKVRIALTHETESLVHVADVVEGQLHVPCSWQGIKDQPLANRVHATDECVVGNVVGLDALVDEVQRRLWPLSAKLTLQVVRVLLVEEGRVFADCHPPVADALPVLHVFHIPSHWHDVTSRLMQAGQTHWENPYSSGLCR